MPLKIRIHNLNEARGAFNGDRFMARSLAEKIYVDEILYAEGLSLSEANMDTLSKNERGGIITFSTDMNSTQLSSNRLVNFIKQKFNTVNYAPHKCGELVKP